MREEGRKREAWTEGEVGRQHSDDLSKQCNRAQLREEGRERHGQKERWEDNILMTCQNNATGHS